MAKRAINTTTRATIRPASSGVKAGGPATLVTVLVTWDVVVAVLTKVFVTVPEEVMVTGDVVVVVLTRVTGIVVTVVTVM